MSHELKLFNDASDAKAATEVAYINKVCPWTPPTDGFDPRFETRFPTERACGAWCPFFSMGAPSREGVEIRLLCIGGKGTTIYAKKEAPNEKKETPTPNG
jgi:hypothetical protein